MKRFHLLGKTSSGTFVVTLCTVLLFAVWTNNPFGAQGFPDSRFTRTTTEPGAFTEVSNAIVANTVMHRELGVAPSSFMLLTENNRLKEVREFLGFDHPRLGRGSAPYYSQFGLQADLISGLNHVISNSSVALATARVGLTLAAALAISVFVAWVFRFVGPASAVAVAVVMAFSDWMIIFSQSIYFVVFLNLLAFSLPWWFLCTEHKPTKSRFVLALFIHGTIVFFRSLCGYEYLTCLILAPLPAIAYSVAKLPKPFWGWFRISLSFGLVGSLAFLAALGMHFGKAVSIEHLPPEKALAFVSYRSKDNTQLGLGKIDYVSADSELRKNSAIYQKLNSFGFQGPNAAKVFLTFYRMCGYLGGNFCTLPGKIGFPMALYLVLIGGCFGWYLLTKRKSSAFRNSNIESLAASLCAAFLASFSWYILAFNHSMIHIYYNLICLFFAFVPVSVLFVTKLVECELAAWFLQRRK